MNVKSILKVKDIGFVEENLEWSEDFDVTEDPIVGKVSEYLNGRLI